jgi:hypothetical protein
VAFADHVFVGGASEAECGLVVLSHVAPESQLRNLLTRACGDLIDERLVDPSVERKSAAVAGVLGRDHARVGPFEVMHYGSTAGEPMDSIETFHERAVVERIGLLKVAQ